MPTLRRDLTLYGLTMVAIGSCIGSGIFVTPAQIAGHLLSPTPILTVWVLGGLIALTGALTFAELGSMFPEAGGVYVYLKEGYGDFAGFLYGWAYFTVINSGSLAALSIAFAYYISFLIPLGATGQLVLAVGAIVVITVVNVFRVKVAELFTNVFTGLKLLGIAAVILIGLFLGSAGTLTASEAASPGLPEGTALSAFGLALIGVLWSYGGWQHASYLSGEARDAQRTVPRAMILGAMIVTIVYVLTNLSYLFLLPVVEMATSDRVAADAVSRVLPYGGSLIAAIIAISTFGTAMIYMMSAPRIYFAMAGDGVFFAKLAEVHPVYRTPVYAVLAQSVWAVVLLLFWGTFEAVITYVTFTDWIFFTLAAFVVVLFRYTRKEALRPYRTFGYPFTPIVFMTITTLFVLNTLVAKPLESGAGLLLLALGFPVYRYFVGKREGETPSE